MSYRKLRMYWVDVFAERRFEGNQLAVFTDASRLTAAEMQSIAREMNLSESIFITGVEFGKDAGMVFPARIFTKEGELPFAGHPTLGASYILRGIYCTDSIRLKLKVGTITVGFTRTEGTVFGEMVQKGPAFGKLHPKEKVAPLLGIDPDDIDDSLPLQTVSTGNPFVLVPLRSLEKLKTIRPDVRGMEDYLKGTDARSFYLTSRETQDREAILHARMIAGDGEDPATGSAAGPAAAWLLQNGVMEPEKQHWIEQGIEMGRPSRIFVRGEMQSGKPANIRVGGHCVMVVDGELEY